MQRDKILGTTRKEEKEDTTTAEAVAEEAEAAVEEAVAEVATAIDKAMEVTVKVAMVTDKVAITKAMAENPEEEATKATIEDLNPTTEVVAEVEAAIASATSHPNHWLPSHQTQRRPRPKRSYSRLTSLKWSLERMLLKFTNMQLL